MSSSPSPSSNSSTSPSPDVPSRSLPSKSFLVDSTQKKRAKLPKEATEYLKDWLHSHATHPYPSEEEKTKMCAKTGLTLSQISNWMINARRRILAPLQHAERSLPTQAVEADHVLLLPPDGSDAALLLHGLPSMPLDDLDLFFSSPALTLPSHAPSVDAQFQDPPPQLLHAAHSTPATVYPAHVRQKVFPGYTFTQPTSEAQAAYAMYAMQAEHLQRAMSFTPATFPYW